jgi:hypothetical protein
MKRALIGNGVLSRTVTRTTSPDRKFPLLNFRSLIKRPAFNDGMVNKREAQCTCFSHARG